MTVVEHAFTDDALPRLTAAEWAQRTAFTGIGRIPQCILRRVAGNVVNSDGDVMAPEIAILMKAAAAGPDFSDGTVGEARTSTANDCRVFADDAPVMETEEFVLPGGVRATLYRPARRSNGLVVFVHGGGFVLGSRADYDAPVRLIAERAGVAVLSVEYRLAPENRFPGPVDDVLDAWTFAVDRAAEWGVDPHKLILLGDSAGANLCAVASNELVDEKVRPRLQVLMYPVVDGVGDYPSRREFAENPALTAKQIAWLAGMYLRDGQSQTDPRVSPMYVEDLSGAPATLITVAGFDPLRDEALAYASRLGEAGVPTRVMREGGLVHGYISYTRISPAARAAVDRVADAIGRAIRI